MVISLFILAILLGSTVGLDNGLARTPPMGWNPFNAFLCEADEASYRAAAQALVQTGLSGHGYKNLNMDCGWQSTEREISGTITWNTTRIPSGIPALSEYVHSLGLLFGVFSDAGHYSCDPGRKYARWVGSMGYEQSDANTFAQWGADYLKYDNCYVMSERNSVDYYPTIQEEPLYTTMGNAVSNSGRKIVYSISEWGIQDPARWAWSYAHSWRISSNIELPPSFESLKRIINQLAPITQFTGPGAWNDLDLLEVGNEGLTEVEWATQFAFWAAAKSPLLISTDLTTISDSALNILSNQGLIAINQDSLGQSISLMRRYTDDYDVWAGPLADGSTVAVLLNWMDNQQSITFNVRDAGLVSADITDVWTGTNLAKAATTFTNSVEAHGALVYKLTNGAQAPEYQYQAYFADGSSATLGGGAFLRAITDTANVASNIGFGGTITFSGIDGGANGGTKLVWLGYVNADYTFFNTGCSNCRWATVSVNGGTPVVAEVPISGQSWDIVNEDYMISMDGFVSGANNVITISNPTAWAPDIYSVAVEVDE